VAADPYARLRTAVERFVRDTGGPGAQAPPGAGRPIPPGMVGVTIVDDSAEQRAGLSRIFDAFDATVADFPAVLEAAVPTIREAHRAVFTSEGAAGRGAWPALAPRTLRDRARLGFAPGPILVRTGQLRDHVLSAPAKITRRGSSVELRIEPAGSVGGVPKYVANALGTSTIPGRPMVAIGPAAAVKVTSTVQRALREVARRNGLR